MSDKERARELRRQILDLHEQYKRLLQIEIAPLETELLEIMNRNAPRFYLLNGELVTKHIWED